MSFHQTNNIPQREVLHIPTIDADSFDTTEHLMQRERSALISASSPLYLQKR